MRELVSVIVPYFKKKKFIKKTINSGVNQTYKKLEIIIVYDDEDQRDLKFIKKLRDLDSRIKLIVNKKNLGAGYSRNIGIKFSKGKYVAFIDSDDIWKKNKILKQYKMMKEKSYKITYTSYELINENDFCIGKMNVSKYLSYNDFIKSCDIALSSVMIEKKILKNEIFANLRTKEDYYLWLRLSKNHKFYGIQKFLTKWRSTKNSLSSNIIQKLCDSFILYNKKMKINYFVSLFYVLRLSIFYLNKKLRQRV